MKKTIQVLKPTYYDKFHCIGGACEDNCCDRPWKIQIDKKTYLKYRDIKHPEVRAAVEKSVKRVRDDTAGVHSYAVITQDEAGRCPLHTAEGLCMIHKELGAEYLCDTCQIYPRLVGRMEGERVERALNMSCPEAVRVALLDTEPMGFEIVEEELDGQGFGAAKRINHDLRQNKSGYRLLAWPLREASIDIMQCREYSVEMRLFIIGMLMRRVTELGKAGKWQEIADILPTFVRGAQSGEFHQMADFPPDDEMKKQVRYITCGLMLERAVVQSTANKMCGRAIVSSLKDATEEQKSLVDEAVLESVYARKKAEFWPGFLEKYSHVLENYFVNYFYARLFPIDAINELDPYQVFCTVAEQLAFLRMLLCLLSEDGRLDEGTLVLAISSVAVMGENSEAFRKINQDVYVKLQAEGLAHMYFTVLD